MDGAEAEKNKLKVETLFLLYFQKRKRKEGQQGEKINLRRVSIHDMAFFHIVKTADFFAQEAEEFEKFYLVMIGSFDLLFFAFALSLSPQLPRTKPQRKMMLEKSISHSYNTVIINIIICHCFSASWFEYSMSFSNHFVTRLSLIRCPRNAEKLRRLLLCSLIEVNDERKTRWFFFGFFQLHSN